MAVVSRPRLHSHDSGCTDDSAVGGKPRSSSESSGSSSDDDFERDSKYDSLDRKSPYHTSRKPMIQDNTRDHETTTSDTPNYPTIDLTNVGMSSSDNNENPRTKSTIGMTNMDLSSSENKEIAYNNGEKR